MRWTPIAVIACVSVSAAQQPPRTPPPTGVEISARDGDRIIVDDDARIQIVRRRQATVRTIFHQERRLLIVLADYSKPGEFPDGMVDWAFNFYDVEGNWPLGQRWEALTNIFQYEGDPPLPKGLALATPQGLVQLLPGGPGMSKPDPSALVVLSFRGSSSSMRGSSFAEAETVQLADAARSKASGATVTTLEAPSGAGLTGTGTGSASATMGTAAVTGGIRGPNGAPRKIRHVAAIYPEAARQANVSGNVILELKIDVNGTVTDVRVLRSIPLLDAVAIEAAKQWQYEPMLLNGRPVPILTVVTIPFAP
jgi:TonB family protein